MRLVVLLLAAMTVLVPTIASSQPIRGQATPVVDGAGAVCAREGRTVEELRDLGGPPRESAVVISEFSDFPDALPSGVPASPETVAEIRAMLEEFVTCIQGGQVLRGFAYLSDFYLREVAFLNDEFLADLETATPTPEPEIGFFTLRDVTRAETLADGRVGAVITYGGACERSQPDPTCTFYLFFVEQGGRWFLDDQIDDLVSPDGLEIITVPEYLELEGTPVATPAA